MGQPPPVPIRSPVLEGSRLHRELVRFLDTLREWLSRTAQTIGEVSLTAQAAAIATTDVLTTSPTQDGAYRVSYSLRITQAATTSSAAAVTLGWTTNSVSVSQAFALVTGNTTTSQTSDDITVSLDASTPITYSVSYASVGATPMQYALTLQVEELP